MFATEVDLTFLQIHFIVHAEFNKVNTYSPLVGGGEKAVGLDDCYILRGES